MENSSLLKGMYMFIGVVYTIFFILVCMGFTPSQLSIALAYLILAIDGFYSYTKKEV